MSQLRQQSESERLVLWPWTAYCSPAAAAQIHFAEFIHICCRGSEKLLSRNQKRAVPACSSARLQSSLCHCGVSQHVPRHTGRGKRDEEKKGPEKSTCSDSPGKRRDRIEFSKRLPIPFSAGRDGVRGSVLTRRAAEHLG